MTKSLTLAAALIASAAYGSATLAAGDYYEGVSKDKARQIDHVQTSSIGEREDVIHQQVAQSIDHGEYYKGANRPK